MPRPIAEPLLLIETGNNAALLEAPSTVARRSLGNLTRKKDAHSGCRPRCRANSSGCPARHRRLDERGNAPPSGNSMIIVGWARQAAIEFIDDANFPSISKVIRYLGTMHVTNVLEA